MTDKKYRKLAKLLTEKGLESVLIGAKVTYR